MLEGIESHRLYDLITAWHEAGHITATLFSDYFILNDPAIIIKPGHQLAARLDFQRSRPTDTEPHLSNSVRELVRNAWAGKAAEELLGRLSQEADKAAPA